MRRLLDLLERISASVSFVFKVAGSAVRVNSNVQIWHKQLELHYPTRPAALRIWIRFKNELVFRLSNLTNGCIVAATPSKCCLIYGQCIHLGSPGASGWLVGSEPYRRK